MSHLKRLAMPRSWALARKGRTWIARPRPGPHTLERSMPLSVVLRDALQVCDSDREARRIIAAGNVLVDQRVVRRPRWPVGLMDVLSLPLLKAHYRVVLDPHGKLRFVPLKAAEAKWKLVRVENRTTVRGGGTQLNFHDGRNLLHDGEVKTGDTLQVSLPAWKVKRVLRFAEGAPALIIGGSHRGTLTSIVSRQTTRGPRPNVVHCDGFETIAPYTFVVGDDQPLVRPPEVRL